MDGSGFSDVGFVGPRRVLSRAECRGFMARLDKQPAPLEWVKGRAATSTLFYEVATRRSILKPVIEILGKDVVLWGASIARRQPGDIHHPHVDIEVADPDIRAVSVWIGLENTTRESSLWVVSGSHRLGLTIQEVAAAENRTRGEYGLNEVAEWASQRDATCEQKVVEMTDGEALWFDGHLWHGSDNASGATRTALLLQYAAADSPIRIPNLEVLEHPFELFEEPRPPCIVVAGDGGDGVNRLVPPPPRRGSVPAISTSVHQITLPLTQKPGEVFTPHPYFRGATPNTKWVSAHASILESGESPHPPHTHANEEILLVLDGTGELVLGEEERVVPARRGILGYYPDGYPHTIRSVGHGPVQYLMVKWMGKPRSPADPVPDQLLDIEDLWPDGDDIGHRVLFAGPGRRVRRLQCHLTTLAPGAGYEPHVDSHDVTIVLVEGTVETLGQRVTGPAVVHTSGGWPHGIRNVGDRVARYLVIELHGPGPGTPLTAGGTESAGSSSRRRGVRAALWSAGGRALARFPRAKRVVRRLVGRLSPWG